MTYAAAPVVAKAAPVAVAPAPAAVPTVASSQYQAQDEFANFNYGYNNINSAKVETGNAYTGVTGSYKYVDAHGLPQRVDYIADGAGFRITGATNLPVAPVFNAALPVAPVFEGAAPAPVADTPEVIAAKEEFFKAFEAAKSRAKRGVMTYAAAPAVAYAGLNPYYYGGYNGYSLATPVTYAAAPVQAVTYTAAAPAPAVVAKAAPAIAAAPAVVAKAAPAIAAPAVVAEAAPAIAAPAVAATYAAAPAVVASAPAARDAVLTKVKLNPGHALAYRVY